MADEAVIYYQLDEDMYGSDEEVVGFIQVSEAGDKQLLGSLTISREDWKKAGESDFMAIRLHADTVWGTPEGKM